MTFPAAVLHRLGAALAIVLFWPMTALAALGARLGALVSFRHAQRFHHWWGRSACRLFAVTVNVRGLEHLDAFRDARRQKKTGAILAANHESLFDIFVLATLPFDFGWIAKEPIRRIPFIGTAMRGLGCFFLRRDGGARDLSVMKVVEDGLRLGKSVAIFPEGTRSLTGALLPMKKGAFRTAIGAEAPIVPVRIRGTFRITPAGALPSRLGHAVSVHLGPPLFPASGETAESLAKRFVVALKSL